MNPPHKTQCIILKYVPKSAFSSGWSREARELVHVLNHTVLREWCDVTNRRIMSRKVEQLRTRADFRRMVSWELSEVKERMAKKKKKGKRSQANDEQLIESTTTDARDGKVNIDDETTSEEESFYSAPESPLSSDETTSPVATVPPGAVDSVALPEPTTKRGSRSKRKKKQKAKLRKEAREEFFRPICELFEDEDSVLAVSDLSLTDMGNVLSLTELCLIKMKEVVKCEY